jgi:hypothetical protein
MSETTLLSTKVSVAVYRKMEQQRNCEAIAEFIHHRFRERYIIPVLSVTAEEKNGFLIMGVSCLLIETLETFYQGWESTEPTKKEAGKSKLAFTRFFEHQWQFKPFQGHAHTFWKHVRCGILHQGESTGGWRIKRSGPLFDENDLLVNATKFHRSVSGALDNYRAELIRCDWNSERWCNFRIKMNATIKNCER